MAEQSKQDITTGNSTSRKPTDEGAENMAEGSIRAQAVKESASIRVDQLLSLLQTDCFDLQAMGLKLVMTGTMSNRLAILIEFPGHVLGFENGKIKVDSKPII